MPDQPPPEKGAATRSGWLVKDRPDLVVVRSRGLGAEIHGGWLVLCIALLVGIRFLAGPAAAAWFSLPMLLAWLSVGTALHLVRVEQIRATPESLDLERRGLGGARRLALVGRPEDVRPQRGLLAALFAPHLVVTHAGRACRFARSMTPEARAWLLGRLRRMWGMDRPEVDPPPRDRR